MRCLSYYLLKRIPRDVSTGVNATLSRRVPVEPRLAVFLWAVIFDGPRGQIVGPQVHALESVAAFQR